VRSVMADWVSTYRPVIAALSGFKDYGNGRGRALCPCQHRDGSDADLSLAIGRSGTLIVRCYPRSSNATGCSADDVMRRLGLSMSHLFPDWAERTRLYQERAMRNNTGEEYAVEGEYEYFDVDANGDPVPLFTVVKKKAPSGAKDFPQKRRNPKFDTTKPPGKDNPRFLWETRGVKKVLFGLPELRAALRERRERYVFVVEGEKDVVTARKIGLTATCNPGGTLKWTEDSYTTELTGCNVVVIPDEDTVYEDKNKPGLFRCPGVEHARQVCEALLGKAASVRVLRLPDVPESGDLTDWYERQDAATAAAAVRKLLDEGHRAGVIPSPVAVEFVE